MKRNALILVLLAVGCESKQLETGYQPRKLTDTPSERRAYYANPYSPEANQVDPQGRGDSDIRRPRGF